MDRNDIVDYVNNTPGNTNPTVLGQMIDALGSGSGADGVWESGIGTSSVQTVDSDCVARGEYSVAEGLMSHAGTTETIEDWAEGKGAHAEGGNTIARGNYSHAEGNSTVTNNPYEHAEGHFNISNTNEAIYPSADNTIHSIGIGSNLENRKNAIEVMQNGDAYLYGVGNYNGTNPSDADTLQEVINKNKLPEVTEIDNGKVLTADDGEWVAANPSGSDSNIYTVRFFLNPATDPESPSYDPERKDFIVCSETVEELVEIGKTKFLFCVCNITITIPAQDATAQITGSGYLSYGAEIDIIGGELVADGLIFIGRMGDFELSGVKDETSGEYRWYIGH